MDCCGHPAKVIVERVVFAFERPKVENGLAEFRLGMKGMACFVLSGSTP